MFDGEPTRLIKKYYPHEGSEYCRHVIARSTGLDFSIKQIQQRAAALDLSMTDQARSALGKDQRTRAVRRSVEIRASRRGKAPRDGETNYVHGRYAKPPNRCLADLSLSPWALLCVPWGRATNHRD